MFKDTWNICCLAFKLIIKDLTHKYKVIEGLITTYLVVLAFNTVSCFVMYLLGDKLRLINFLLVPIILTVILIFTMLSVDYYGHYTECKREYMYKKSKRVLVKDML